MLHNQVSVSPQARANVCTGDPRGQKKGGRGESQFSRQPKVVDRKSTIHVPTAPLCSRCALGGTLLSAAAGHPFSQCSPWTGSAAPPDPSKTTNQPPSFLAQKAKFRVLPQTLFSELALGSSCPLCPLAGGFTGRSQTSQEHPTALLTPGILWKRPSFKPQRALCSLARQGKLFARFF